MMLREYQQRAIDQLYSWFADGNKGNPCLVLPTGSGKSHIVAALCKDALQNWPETQILMLTHIKELIEQNAQKMRQHWPGAPMGIYSAGMGKRQLGEPITFAGIQSVRNKAEQIGHVDLVIIDECFVAGTQISTPKGLVSIDQVRCGDVVYNQSGVGMVEAVRCKPAREIYKLELEDGRIIECTGNHKLFTQSGWLEARELEVGTYLLGIEDMRWLWEHVSSLEKIPRERNYAICSVGAVLENADLLLSQVCKEVSSNGIGRTSSQENQPQVEGDKAQTYKAWRERAIAAFASIGTTARAGGWVGGGATDYDECGPQKRDSSERVQSGYSEQIINDCHRVRRRIAFDTREASTRSEKNTCVSGSRLVGVSIIKRESPIPVFNIQVTGHPSYFANGIAAHNCHLVSHKDEGGYRTLLSDIYRINPDVRVIGLTATPYRMGHGLITDKPAMFDALIEPTGIQELIFKGYLATLRSKITKDKLDTSGVHKRGGEFIESELQAAVDTDDQNSAIVREVICMAGDRKAWLFFCTGVNHAHHVCDALISQGVPAACVTGETPKKERAQILDDYKAGKLRALTNANVLTTGFDYPDIDLIAMLRPTMSPGLYVQMAGRGLRPKSHTDHCLVLDFAGVVETHGPITNVQPPKKAGDGNGEAPVKVCDNCQELCAIAALVCPACGHPFPAAEPEKLQLRNDDIMGIEGKDLDVTSWSWRVHTSKTSGKMMLACTYYGGLSERPVSEYFAVLHDGYAGQKARQQLFVIATSARACEVLSGKIEGEGDLQWVSDGLNLSTQPSSIEYRMDGKFHRVLNRKWI